MKLRYRPDIDGLRAVAVLSVIFFHLKIFPFSGGYVGVDIFFVISGYLITSIIVREIDRERFSIAGFYERRFRRILPALTVVVAFSLAVGSIMLSPGSLVELGQSAVSTSVFSSNMQFYLESGYFDAPAESKPLLHTWSLAVEEQYYIFFPLLMIWIAKAGSKKYAKWLICFALVSFAGSIVSVKYDRLGAFYLIPNRAWELFMGSLLAIGVMPRLSNQRLVDLLSMVGIAMIGASVFLFTSETPFPGAAAAIPTVGAALIIYSGMDAESVVGKVLSRKPVVFIGLISYSLYLWHWPILVYAKYYSIQELDSVQILVLMGVILGLSVLSWKYIETPFRTKTLIFERKKLFRAALAASLLIFLSGSILISLKGFPNRLNHSMPNITLKMDTPWKIWGRCENAEEKIKRNEKLCSIGKKGERSSFILWGDSHARAIATAVDTSAKLYRKTGDFAAKSRCPPLLDVVRKDEISCDGFNKAVLNYIAERKEIKTVILAARWSLPATGTRYKQEPGGPVKLVDLSFPNSSNQSNMDLFKAGFEKTVDRLLELGRKVVVVKQVPDVGIEVHAAHYVSNLTGQDVNDAIAPTLEEHLRRTQNENTLFSKLEKEKGIKILDPTAYFCDNTRCRVASNNIALYHDHHHLSTHGSKYVYPLFNETFRTMAGASSLALKNDPNSVLRASEQRK